ncbi:MULTISPECIES: hypothetical protein [Roseobacteraceae]|uniref:Uncharacterized protein n=1 Tax=Falsiruegeria litorea TaxID=1280831 RepID=A0ABS5WWM2_9RHOB|nr:MULTISPECIES: hypothetical protein [Roseobacteraceae]MBT3143541.1 hypothetical protein [Falsiruegeria litorea]MBT8167811.1 hypothetical protein [Falsiruegeria litorea]
MSKVNRTPQVASPKYHGVAPWKISQAGYTDRTGMFGMLVVAIVAALLVGTLSFLIFMSGGTLTHALHSGGVMDAITVLPPMA